MTQIEKRIALRWLFWIMAIAVPAMAAEVSKPDVTPLPNQPVSTITEKTQQPVAVYAPPLRGMPVKRIGAATRNAAGELPTLTAIVPEHTGLTLQTCPDLYWHVSKPTFTPIEISLIDDIQFEPLWQSRISHPVPPGFHRIRLADTGLKLETGKTYKWFVAMVVDPDHRSRDVIAGGAIERVNASESLTRKLSRSDPLQQISVLAEEGIWYDTLSAISHLIDTRPGESALEDIRMDLLEQVGLEMLRKGK